MLRPLSLPVKTSLRKAVDLMVAAMPGSAAQEYVQARGIGLGVVERLKLGYVEPGVTIDGFQRFAGRLAIPNINGAGDVVGVKFRALSDDEERKYDGLAGLEKRLLNLRALNRETSTIVICEGEMEFVTWEHLGIPAVGVAGGGGWQRHHRRLFEGYERVVVVKDDDEAGDRIAAPILKDLDNAIGVTVPGFKDANEALMAGVPAAELVRLVQDAGVDDDRS